MPRALNKPTLSTDPSMNKSTRDRAPAASGGGGVDLPPFDYNMRAGKSTIGGSGIKLPKVAANSTTNSTTKSKFPGGNGPRHEPLQPPFASTAQRTGSILSGDKTGPRDVKPILSNTGSMEGKRTAWTG
ncbi:Uu.00g013580.m01.CDS01 [Anthostomella pinea]|uniref:Uu.00g013580.m01.CDS01 n=1 Tax=Anthostomella pinea TaxID=933095 RepID=A0AAI8VY53_9PEZI|nr:Uu.00g013580.m01.CDS01 [Anthostomella pinea]